METTPPNSLPGGLPLPEMREAVLSAEEVQSLVADLQAFARVTRTTCKAAARRQTPPLDIPLSEAVRRLLAKTAPAIQVHYQYDGHEWTDTLMNTPGGVRLVRCQHAGNPASRD